MARPRAPALIFQQMRTNGAVRAKKTPCELPLCQADQQPKESLAQIARFQRETAFGYRRGASENRFVSPVISQRAGGLTLEINLNPVNHPTYADSNGQLLRPGAESEWRMDLAIMLDELDQALMAIHTGRLRQEPWCRNLPPELLQLRHIAFSGDREPTMAPTFFAAIKALVHVRAAGRFPLFKLMLSTDASRLDHPEVQLGLKWFSRADEIWVKLAGGTQYYLDQVNCLKVPIETILKNILLVARKRPVVIQSMFPEIKGEEPALEEIMYYVQRLGKLQEQGAQIALVQIYSASRTLRSGHGHLALKTLSYIAQSVRHATGLRAEVF